MMKRSDLTEFEIEEKDLKLRICRHSGKAEVVAVPQGGSNAPFPVVTQVQVPAPDLNSRESPSAEEKGVDYILSPMVGTFYRASSPDTEPYVETGRKVNSETIVCIIEAMKVMNEIHAERSGTIMEILVENGEPVEYNQPLFKVKTG